MRPPLPLIVFARSHTRLAALALAFVLATALVFVVFAGAARAQVPGLPSFAPPAAAQGEEAPAAQAPLEADLEALIRVLQDDAARARLIEALGASAAPEAAVEVAAEQQIPFARQVAERTRAVAEQIAGLFAVTGRAAETLTGLYDGVTWRDIERLANVLSAVVLVIAGTILAYLILRNVAGRIADRAARHRSVARLPGRIVLALAAFALEAVALALAWVIGNGIAVASGRHGLDALNQTLFLNAFVLSEAIKLVARAVLKPNRVSLRLVPMSDTNAAYWYFWITRAVMVVVYTFMFVAPILAWNVSPAAANAARMLAVLAACVVGILVVLQNKEPVRRLIARRALAGETDAFARLSAAIGRVWHIFAVVYFVAIFVVWMTRPRDALAFMLSATLESAIAIAVGIAVAAAITRLISGGMRLSEDVKQRLPLLEQRLNAFVPNVLRFVRIVVMFGVVVAIGQAWDLFDFLDWASTGVGLAVTTSLISASLILVIAVALYIVVSSWVEYRLNPDCGTQPTPRERTLLSLFRNAFTVTLWVVVAIMILSELGVNVGPLLAGAGVIGLAVGFGAQKLVQDVITGIFIQLENAMNEGDVVTAGGISGVVERLTIRSVSMRDLNGVYHVIPFSSVDMVSNMMRHFSFYVADVGVAYREKVSDVKKAMCDAFALLEKSEEHGPNIVGPFEMMGLDRFEDSAVIVRGRIKTLPGKQWATGRAYNEILKEVFDERGIEIPFPHLTIYPGVDKTGMAPPLRVLQEEGERAPERPPSRREVRARKEAALASVDSNVVALPEESGVRVPEIAQEIAQEVPQEVAEPVAPAPDRAVATTPGERGGGARG
ncbi:mechanosensitive ion channel domain-containing protein [Salinarimonas sp.]|uniref:mechanosensitive ion channel domain-containing protein n=1 Tax=Salinarimonas sp. TaxID=2766526 RepID=UPI00391C5428